MIRENNNNKRGYREEKNALEIIILNSLRARRYRNRLIFISDTGIINSNPYFGVTQKRNRDVKI